MQIWKFWESFQYFFLVDWKEILDILSSCICSRTWLLRRFSEIVPSPGRSHRRRVDQASLCCLWLRRRKNMFMLWTRRYEHVELVTENLWEKSNYKCPIKNYRDAYWVIATIYIEHQTSQTPGSRNRAVRAMVFHSENIFCSPFLPHLRIPTCF